MFGVRWTIPADFDDGGSPITHFRVTGGQLIEGQADPTAEDNYQLLTGSQPLTSDILEYKYDSWLRSSVFVLNSSPDSLQRVYSI